MKLLKFEAAWCQPCKAIKPIVERVCKEQGIDLITVDVDKTPAKAQQFNVRGLPTLILLDQGKEIKRITGSMNEAKLRSWLN